MIDIRYQMRGTERVCVDGGFDKNLGFQDFSDLSAAV